MSGDELESRVRLLMRLYPRSWRERYGEEFAALLYDDMSERPQCWARTLDVARGGLTARMSAAGLAPGPICRSASTTITVALVVVLAAGLSIWAQLVGGTAIAGSDSPALSLGSLALSITGVCLAGVAVIAIAPVVRELIRQPRRLSVAPLIRIIAAVSYLLIGGVHATRWVQGAGPARFARAETLSINAFWVHPSRLLALPAAELAWMASSVAAAAVATRALIAVGRSCSLPADVLRFELRLAQHVVLGMLPAFVAAGLWVIGSQRDPQAVYRAGTLDLGLLLVVATSLAALALSTQRASSLVR